MQTPFNFKITSGKKISTHFQSKNIFDFRTATDFIRYLPYGRNANKNDRATVFNDNCGTCSTRHALLKELAIENVVEDVKLILSIFKMNATNTPAIKNILLKNKLDHIPEAHNYLLAGNEYIDCTWPNASRDHFVNDIITEIEIEPNQMTDFKVKFLKDYLQQWLSEQKKIKLSLEELWIVREQCIKQLTIEN